MANSSVFLDLFKQQPTREQLAVAFDNLEADVTYIDDTATVIYFSPFRIFSRPASILGQSVFDCHAPSSYKPIEEMLAAFKAGTKDKVSHPDVSSKNGRKVQVCYQAMRTPEGEYLGCLEAVTYRD